MRDGLQHVARWFEAHNRPLVLYARQWLDDHAAADVAQEAFVKLLDQRRPPDDVRAWLFRTVRNAALNELRRRRTRAAHAGRVAAGRAAWFESSLDGELDAQAAQTALEQLPPDQRELIVLRIWGGMTYGQMAHVTDAAVSTVHARYAEALAALRRRMVTP